MQIFKELVAFLAEVPAWIPLILCPALVVLAAAAFALFGGRRAYPVLAGILGAAGVAFMSASASGSLLAAARKLIEPFAADRNSRIHRRLLCDGATKRAERVLYLLCGDIDPALRCYGAGYIERIGS